MTPPILFVVLVSFISPADSTRVAVPCRQDPEPAAAVTARPGDGKISGTFLRPYAREAQQIATAPDGRVLNARPRWRDELTEVSLNGRVLMQRIVQMIAFNGTVHAVDTVLFDPATLSPVYNAEWVQGTVAWQRSYAGNKVTGQKLAATAGGTGTGVALGDPSARLDVILADRVYDFFGGMDGLIAASIDLTAGKSTRIPVFDPANDKACMLELRVVGQESVEAGRGKLVPASIVAFDGLNGPMRLWVGRDSPFVYKTEEILLREGQPWRIITTVMVN